MTSALTNMYEPETGIMSEISSLFEPDMVFSESEINEIDKDIFDDLDEDKKVAAVVLYSGFSVPESTSRGAQLISPLWRVIVVTPSELYKSLAGVKLMQVIETLKGYSPVDGCKPMRLVTDVREFNQPDFINNMSALPVVFSFDVVVV